VRQCLSVALAVTLLALGATATAADQAPRIKVALTWDDLPVNGPIPSNSSASQIARETLAVLKKHKIPPSHGFINAQQLQRAPDGAVALKLWIDAGHPLANHTYSHMDLTTHTAEEFWNEVLRNEPVLELLAAGKHGVSDSWRWFRYPYLHEGDTLEKRRAIRASLKAANYRIAQTTLDYEDYLWNNAYARCSVSGDGAAIVWLKKSYLESAERFLRLGRDNARTTFGRDISHVLLLHLGAFSSTILPDLFALLEREGYEIVTLEEAQKDPVYDLDPDVANQWGGTHTDLIMESRKLPYPKIADKPRKELEAICR
jgi:peptidoglycan-N-acetylglucosamine deacetylase